MVAQYRTLSAAIRYEIEPVKGSRFLASAAPVSQTEEALAYVERIAEEFHKASHHGWAYRLGCLGSEYRCSDDGEPSGSAGRPIHAQIEGHDLSDCVLVVTRWFGGTKLGVGGLMRAYGAAAGHCLDRAAIRTVLVTRRLRVRFPYASSGALHGLLTSGKLQVERSDYGARVEHDLSVPEAELSGFLRELTDRTAGQASCEFLDT